MVEVIYPGEDQEKSFKVLAGHQKKRQGVLWTPSPRFARRDDTMDGQTDKRKERLPDRRPRLLERLRRWQHVPHSKRGGEPPPS
ncbi:hypothetical protein KM043_017263 [Ampulex compressa]|nr:hypothetical protein KM043_017263 [Ampulex compressa]